MTSETWNCANDHSELKYFGRTPATRVWKLGKKEAMNCQGFTVSIPNAILPISAFRGEMTNKRKNNLNLSIYLLDLELLSNQCSHPDSFQELEKLFFSVS